MFTSCYEENNRGFAYLLLHNGEADVAALKKILQHKCTTTSGLLKFSMSQDSAISNVKWSKNIMTTVRPSPHCDLSNLLKSKTDGRVRVTNRRNIIDP